MTKKAAATSLGPDLRERVLAAIIELVEKSGLEALSMREVARRAGVSHQAPYHYFPDRESILAAICGQGFALLDARIAAARARGTSASDRLERAGIAYVRFACEHPAHFRMMFRPELVHLGAHEAVNASADAAFAHVPAMVADCVAEGLPAEPNVEALVITFWSFVHGFACLLLDGPLAAKVPGAARETAIEDVARAFRALVDTSIAKGRRAPRKHGPSPRRKAKRARA